MGKVFINEFKNKLAKKIKNSSLDKKIINVNLKSLNDKRIQLFNNGLSEYLLHTDIRKSIKKINDYTVRFDCTPVMSDYGTAVLSYLTLSLINVQSDKELWECVVYEFDELSDNEVLSEKFDSAQIAIEFFINQIIRTCKGN
tara:strand:+ start:238 stop:663 length:426 start_codon:yes stop_codon:yes gene_type:complete